MAIEVSTVLLAETLFPVRSEFEVGPLVKVRPGPAALVMDVQAPEDVAEAGRVLGQVEQLAGHGRFDWRPLWRFEVDGHEAAVRHEQADVVPGPAGRAPRLRVVYWVIGGPVRFSVRALQAAPLREAA